MTKKSPAQVSFKKMRKNTIPMLAGIALLFASNPVVARPVKLCTPTELFERSQLVVIGKATKIEATGKTGTIHLGERNPKIPVAFYSAKVRVVEVIKGEATAKEITVEYSQVDYSRLDPSTLVNGPERFWLEDGGLFLLYLNKIRNGVYVGTLNGDFDDGQASKLLVRKTAESGPGE